MTLTSSSSNSSRKSSSHLCCCCSILALLITLILIWLNFPLKNKFYESAPIDGLHYDGAKTNFGWRKCCVEKSCWTEYSKLDFFERLFECPCKLNHIQNEPKSCDIEILGETEQAAVDLIMVSSGATHDEESVHRRVVREANNGNKSKGSWFQRVRRNIEVIPCTGYCEHDFFV